MYDVYIRAQIPKPWHIYSQNMSLGAAIPTKIKFNKNPDVKRLGSIEENGKLLSKHEFAFNVDVKYYEDSVVFRQRIRLFKSLEKTISGTITYMMCSQKQCLPPKEVFFTINVP